MPVAPERSPSPRSRGRPHPRNVLRWAYNFTAVAIVVGGAFLLHPERRGTRARLPLI